MTEYDVRLIEEYELDSWDELVAASPAGTVYHTSTWRSVINNGYDNGTYMLLGAFDQNGLAGGFCGLMRTKLGVSTVVTPLLTPYIGFFSREWTGNKSSDALSYEGDVLEAICSYLKRFRYQHIQCSPGLADFRALAEAGYRLTPRATLEINLRLPEEELWEKLQGNVRRNIKKARKLDYEITDQWDKSAGLTIFQDTFQRHGQQCPVPEKLFHEIAEGNILDEYRRRYCAWKDGRLEAYLVALRYNGRVYYQLAGGTDEALKGGMSSLLVWEMLRDHLGGHWNIFDFVGANTRSISRFKEGFNPSLRTHLQAELCLSNRIGVGRGIRRLLRRRG